MSEYKVYIDGVQMPLGIEELETSIKNRNDDVDLINGRVKSLPRYPGLTTWKFKVLLPVGYNPDGRSIREPNYYLTKFDALKRNKSVFQFIINRPGLSETNATVTMEDYKIIETPELSQFSRVEITLKQYFEYQAISVTLSKPDDNKYIDPNDNSDENNPVKPDDPDKPDTPDVPSPDNPEEPEQPEYMVVVKEELKRLENRDIPQTFKVEIMTIRVPGERVYRKYMSWKDASMQIFGSEKYWRGLRDTNEDKKNPPYIKYKDHPGELYPKNNATLNIDTEAILAIIAQKYPEDLE